MNSARTNATDSHEEFVRALLEPCCYPHPVEKVELIETHISYVLLAGDYAYKIKKPVNLGFLDFSTLALRQHFCTEEVRLNRRLAPELYLGVVAISGSPEAPRIDGTGEAIEYAVRMSRFSQDALLDRRLASGTLPATLIDRLADTVAEFHDRVATVPADASFGTPAAVWRPVAENFAQLRAHRPDILPPLADLETWSRERFAELSPLLDNRQRDGRVRECHGDLHLGNIALVGENLQIFDGIEFNPNLRWIDVICEIAFLSMDLEARGRPDYAYRLLNRYLEATGDYGGLALLPFYQVYRALVRAKVAAIRADQEAPTDRQDALDECNRYLAFAARASAPGRPLLILMHGLSGSGKTWLSQRLLEDLGAIRLRSDVERKRLCGLPPLARSASATNAGIYTPVIGAATYARLAELAQQVLRAGYPAIIDATCLLAEQRECFFELAAVLRLPLAIVACTATEATLLHRLAARNATADDASEADSGILARQQSTVEPLSPDEMKYCLEVDTSRPLPDRLAARLRESPVPDTPSRPPDSARPPSWFLPDSGDALLVVDVQNDFLPGGRLGVGDGDAVIAPLAAWIARFTGASRPVFASRDWHPADHCSFQPFGGQWPVHCVAGSPGAAFAMGLGLPANGQIVDKATRQDREAYSAFAGTDLDARLRAHDVERIMIGGLATDYCVLNTTLDALRLGYRVLVLTGACRAVDVQAGDGARALAAMEAAGAQFLGNSPP